MSAKQWKRLDAVLRIERGDLSLGQAAQVLGLSKRQVRRLRERVRSTAGTRSVWLEGPRPAAE